MKNSIGDLSTRISKLESTIDEKIQSRVKTAVSNEFTKLKKDLNTQMQDIRREMKEVSSSNDNHSDSNDNIALNIVIRNLPERHGEDINERVNTMIQYGLGLRDLSVASAERKTVRDDRQTGVVKAICKTMDDKEDIMASKAKLRDNSQYERVYIEHDKTKERRDNEANLRTIASIVGSDRVYIRGNRLFKKDYDNGPRGYHVNHRNRRDTSRRSPNNSGQRSDSHYHRRQSTQSHGDQRSGDRNGQFQSTDTSRRSTYHHNGDQRSSDRDGHYENTGTPRHSTQRYGDQRSGDRNGYYQAQTQGPRGDHSVRFNRDNQRYNRH